MHCNSLPAPPTVPNQGAAFLVHPGVVLGPCIGRALTNVPDSAPSAPGITVWIVEEEILADGRYVTRVDLNINSTNVEAVLNIVLSHPIAELNVEV